MKKSLLVIAMVLLLLNCSKVTKKGTQIAKKEAVGFICETGRKVPQSLKDRIRKTFPPNEAERIIRQLEGRSEIIDWLYNNGNVFYIWCDLNKQLPTLSLNPKFMNLFIYSEKFSGQGRFAGNKIKNFIFKEEKGKVIIKSKSGFDLGEIIFVDPPKVILYETNKGKVITNWFGNLHPFPNTTYELAGAKYKTDNLGRVVESTFKIDKNYATTPNLYNRKNITAIGKLKGGIAGDDGGHLLGQQFGGSSTVLNVVPMKSSLNRKEYLNLERAWKQAADEGKTVNAKVKLKYEGGSTERPAWIEVNYEIDGKKFTKLFQN